MGSDPKLAENGAHRCDNCRKIWTAEALKDFCDLMERINPGGIVPSGECPECSALCYPYEPTQRVVTLAAGFEDKEWVEAKVVVKDDDADLKDAAAVEEMAKKLFQERPAQRKAYLSFLLTIRVGPIEAGDACVSEAQSEPKDIWGSDEDYPRAAWKNEVIQDETNLGYWEWVANQKERDGDG